MGVTRNCTFLHNEARAINQFVALAGGLQIHEGGVVIDSVFVENRVTTVGGTACGGGAGDGTFAQQPPSPMFSSMTVINCSFVSNLATSFGDSGMVGGGALAANANVYGGEFLLNMAEAMQVDTTTSAQGGAFISSNGAVEGVLFKQNRVQIAGSGRARGGAIWANSLISVSNCRFEDNSAAVPVTSTSGLASGGAIHSNIVDISNSTFDANLAITRGSGDANAGAVKATFVGYISGSKFTGNTAWSDASGRATGGALSGCAIDVASCSFSGNNVYTRFGALAGGGAMFAETDSSWGQSPVTVTDSVFTDNAAKALNWQSGSYGGAIYSNVDVFLQNVTGLRNQAKIESVDFFAVSSAGGFLYVAPVEDDIVAFISDSYFGHQTVYGSGGVLAGEVTNLTVSWTTFDSNLAIQDGGSVQMKVAEGLFADCVFSNGAATNGGAMSLLLNSSVVLQNVTLHGNVANSNGGCIITDSTQLQILHSNLSQNVASKSAGAISAMDSDVVLRDVLITHNQALVGAGAVRADGIGSLVIQNTLISHNVAGAFAGALELGSTVTQIENTVIASNVAGISGGAIYMTASNGTLSMSGSSIRNNTATSGGGGAIFWYGDQPANTKFTFDSATTLFGNNAIYGAELGTVPVQLAAVGVPEPQSGCGVTGIIDMALNMVANVSSGCTLNFNIELRDYYQQIVNVQQPQVDLQQVVDQNCAQACTGGVLVPLAGGSEYVSWGISGQTGVNYCWRFQAVSVASPAVPQFVLQTGMLSGVIKPCNVGFGSDSGLCGTCHVCPSGFWNLQPDSICRDCPENSICEGQFVYPLFGYWIQYNPSTNSLQSYPCSDATCALNPQCQTATGSQTCQYNVTAMPGPYFTCQEVSEPGTVSQFCETLNECLPGRGGFMCGDCLPGYSYWNSECIDCERPSYWLIPIFLLLNWLVVIVLHMLLSGAQSVLSKTLFYYVQVGILILTPSNTISVVLGLLNFRPSGGGLCMFPRDFFGAYVQDLLSPVISLIQLCISFAMMKLANRCLRKQPTDTNRWFVRPLTSLLLASYTPISNAVLNMLNCRTIGDYHVISTQPAHLCNGSVYQPYFIVSVIVSIVVVVGAPVLLAILLLRYQRRLQDDDVRARYGYVYEAYSARCYWWEVVVLVRRTAVTALTLITATAVRNYALWMACVCIFGVQMIFSPDLSAVDNAIDLFALLSLVVLAATNGSTLFADPGTHDQTRFFADAVMALTIVVIVAVKVVRMRPTLLRLWNRFRNVVRRSSSKQEQEQQDEQVQVQVRGSKEFRASTDVARETTALLRNAEL
eukprot:TRINITY_DN4984_c0_g1_i1.p1 TRINITY_DN4984_c0_g1~~TRINITY_DN4984_c0_g1_i1.p1  ORF type:complete len:1463 (-),score=381.60 TRINITY_DN4984_c0_g1_i1:133-4035(-)